MQILTVLDFWIGNKAQVIDVNINREIPLDLQAVDFVRSCTDSTMKLLLHRLYCTQAQLEEIQKRCNSNHQAEFAVVHIKDDCYDLMCTPELAQELFAPFLRRRFGRDDPLLQNKNKSNGLAPHRHSYHHPHTGLLEAVRQTIEALGETKLRYPFKPLVDECIAVLRRTTKDLDDDTAIYMHHGG